MNDEIAFVEFAEIDLRAIASFRALQAPPAVGRKAPEQFGGRKDDEIAGRKTKAAAQRSFEQVDASQCIGSP